MCYSPLIMVFLAGVILLHFSGLAWGTGSSDILTIQEKSTLASVAAKHACEFCHQSLTSAHYRNLNPFVDPLVQPWFDSINSSQAIQSTSLTCFDCHVPHGADAGRFLLSEQYFLVVARSRSINPHWQDLMCVSCHLKQRPTKEDATLAGTGDINEICNRCHHSEFARIEIHPVGITPSKNIRIPSEMPLKDGKLTCETCHESSLQQSAHGTSSVGRENPDFLRNSQLSRTEFCVLCHIRESYRRLNPHKQRDQEGRIKEESCLFCHAVRPDVTVFGMENVKFIIENPNEYCVGCHPGFDKRHPSGGSHLVEPSETILKALKTSVDRIGVELPLYRGKIVCATCHNPHEEGVIEIPAAAQGAQRQNKLRLMPGMNQCIGCHWDK